MADSATPWTAAYQAPPSMRFYRQEYWSGLPFSGDQGRESFKVEQDDKYPPTHIQSQTFDGPHLALGLTVEI